MIKKNDILNLIDKSGIKKGDNIFCHSNLTLFYNLDFPLSELCETILIAFKEKLGEKGTLAVPMFSYDFCNNRVFNVKKINSNTGSFSKYVYEKKSSSLYVDPNLSVAILGKNKIYLSKKPTTNSYSKNSFFDRFFKLNGKICNINQDITSTFIHFFERKINVKYRYDKNFYGVMKSKSKSFKRKSTIFVRYLDPNTKQCLKKLIKKSKKITKKKLIKGNYTNVISLKNYFSLIKNNYKKDSNFLIKGKFYNPIKQI